MVAYLHRAYGWTVSARGVAKGAEVLYLAAYFEAQRLKPWPAIPVAAYFTHREEEPPGNAKAKVFDKMGERVALRVATCEMYASLLRKHGPTIQAAAPIERELFYVDGAARQREKNSRPVVGVSGFTYANRRKGEDLIRRIVGMPIGGRVEWRAAGRGWPVRTVGYRWEQMGDFYRGLDVLVCPSRVEGIPMPPLEALACGASVVIPRGVGLLDELMDCDGIHRYERGNVAELAEALEAAAFPARRPDAEALAAVTAPYSVEAWCEDIRRGLHWIYQWAHGASTV